MRSIELGLVLPMEEAWTDGSTPRWVEIRELALRAEAMGFDTVWIPDELLWRRADGSIHGWWKSSPSGDPLIAVKCRPPSVER